MHSSEAIKEWIEPVLQAMGIDLVDLQVHGRGNRVMVVVLVDEPGGIKLDRCTRASRAISDLLDQKDAIPGRYLLEVSSPGTDRPLKTERDYARHAGRRLWVRMQDAGTEREVAGIIRGIENEVLSLETGEGTINVPMSQIITNKIMVDFKERSSGKRYEK